MRFPYLLALLGLLGAIGFDLLFYQADAVGANLLLAEIIFLGLTYLLAREAKHAIPRRAWEAGIVALAASAIFAIWTSDVSLALAGALFTVSNLLFVAFMLGEEGEHRHPFDSLVAMVVTPIAGAVRALPIIGDLKPSRLSEREAAILKGVVIGIPVALIFVALFAGADATFRGYAQDVIDWVENLLNVGEVIGHLVFILFFAVIFTLFFAAAFVHKGHAKTSAAAGRDRAGIESTVILALVAAIFTLFLLSQLPTLFVQAENFQSLERTYANYARQGFGELAVAALLAINLILFLRIFHGKTVSKGLAWAQGILIGASAIVLVSALHRLKLYIDAYGFTDLRLFAVWFCIIVGILLVGLAVTLITRKDNAWYVVLTGRVAAVAILLFAITAPDALSFRWNVNRLDAGETIEMLDITELSAEAMPAVAQALKNDLHLESNNNIAVPPCRVVNRDFIGNYSEEEINAQTWNLSRIRAKAAIGNLKTWCAGQVD